MNIFSYIKSHISILDVISEYATLRKTGHYYKGHCPFHHERTGSFTVSPAKEIFYCFGCHQGGDVISFIAKTERLTPLEAAYYLSNRYAITLPESLQEEKVKNPKSDYYALCALITQWCHNMLLQHEAPRAYLAKRGIMHQSSILFTIGYFPVGYHALKELIHLAKKHYILTEALLESKIIMEGKHQIYSPFEDRIIFPITDHVGRTVGFGGRIFKEGDTRVKYYNSHENSFFTKGALLFGLHHAKKSIIEEQNVFLVEGYTDCIAMVQAGYTNTVATLGTACTVQHLQQLARYASKLYVLYDSDNAGYNALLRLTQMCWQFDLEVYTLRLPPEEDPASFFARGGNLTTYLNNAVDIFMFFAESLGQQMHKATVGERVNKVRTFLQIIARIQDPLKRDVLLQKAATTFALSLSTLTQELQRIQQKHAYTLHNDQSKISVSKPESTFQLHALEKKLFSAILSNVHVLSSGHEEFLIQHLSFPLNQLLQKLLSFKTKVSLPDTLHKEFFNELEEQEKELLSQILIETAEIQKDNTFELLFEQFKKKQWKLIVHTIQARLVAAQKTPNAQESIAQILLDFENVKEKIKGH